MGEETFLPDKDGKNVTFVEKLMLLFMEIFFSFCSTGIRPRATFVSGEHPTTKLYPQPLSNLL